MNNLQNQNLISLKQFILGALLILIFAPFLFGLLLKIVFSLHFTEQSFDNNDSLEITKFFLLTLSILLFSIYYIFTRKSFYNLILSTLNIKSLNRGKTYVYILIANIFVVLSGKTTDLISNDSANIQAIYLGIDTLSEQSFIIYIIAISTHVLIGPVLEEILYRGIILRFLEIKYSFFTGLIISSLLFGLAHNYNFAFIIFATLMGIIYGLLYKKTNSIIPVIIGHMIYNLYTFI
ncbi:type II CAAX endopeptidase family protein [Bacillus pseudomycoides]|uniref:CPBP family intramembrane glutamic endopeptidase n=1 Tax=Bacillus TaxID=1386 RepID=UPI0022487716|nr:MULTISPECIES: type II CAAX endopeptidase family protein [Bacillus]MCX2829570.1 type II CAAX endopeptidase family protein [Bacillus sp. DHT2]MDR4918619.1 type II CAAX endopeptidase family protein [Bacillus pseudomycoides]